MILVRRIDVSTGEFLEDVAYQDSYTDGIKDPMPNDLIAESVPNGFINPAWDGAKWIDAESQSDKDLRIKAVGIKQIESAVESKLSALVADLGYTMRNGYAKYVGYVNDLQAESEAVGVYESQVWSYCKIELEKVNNGSRALPTVPDFLAELPVFT